MNQPAQCYGILNTTGELIRIKYGESGFYPINDPGLQNLLESTGCESYDQLADWLNEQNGLSKAVRVAYEYGSMFSWESLLANPQNYNDDGSHNRQRLAEKSFETAEPWKSINTWPTEDSEDTQIPDLDAVYKKEILRVTGCTAAQVKDVYEITRWVVLHGAKLNTISTGEFHAAAKEALKIANLYANPTAFYSALQMSLEDFRQYLKGQSQTINPEQ